MSSENQDHSHTPACACDDPLFHAQSQGLREMTAVLNAGLRAEPPVVDGVAQDRMSSVEYVQHGAQKCPVCKGDDISAGVVQVDGTQAWADVECGSCNATWRDLFTLVGYEMAK